MASPPRSYVLVALQVVLIAAIVLPWRIAGWTSGGSALVAIGLVLGAWTLTANRLGNFGILPEPKSGARLVTSGPYRFVRHPMYLAVLIVAAGFAVGYSGTGPWRSEDFARACAWIGLVAVLHAKAAIEERALGARFPEYAAYARRAKRIVPFVF
jgi:protein-S-isoprenylcysteine O-methyltransferase Ste14